MAVTFKQCSFYNLMLCFFFCSVVLFPVRKIVLETVSLPKSMKEIDLHGLMIFFGTNEIPKI